MNQYILIALLHIIVILPLAGYLVWALSQPEDEKTPRTQSNTVAWLLAFIALWGAIYHGISLVRYKSMM